MSEHMTESNEQAVIYKGTAHGSDPRYHRISDGAMVCDAPADAPCRTNPMCECEQWCSCDGTDQDAQDNHDGGHCCMLTAKPGRSCWMLGWTDAVGIEDTFGGDPLPIPADADEVVWPDGPVICDWDDSVVWLYAERPAGASS